MKMFTVIGYWEDSHQRFMDSTVAKDAADAEKIIGRLNDGLIIVASIVGDHKAADNKVYIEQFTV